MKIKKWFFLTFVCMCLLLSSQSVFADSENHLSTYSDDEWSDNWKTATRVNLNGFYSDYLDSSDDADYYLWTNNTGTNVIVNMHLVSPYYKNYDVAVIDYYGDIFGTDQGSLGKTDSVSYHVTNGDMLLWKVVPHTSGDFSTTKNYWTYINVKPANY